MRGMTDRVVERRPRKQGLCGRRMLLAGFCCFAVPVTAAYAGPPDLPFPGRPYVINEAERIFPENYLPPEQNVKVVWTWLERRLDEWRIVLKGWKRPGTDIELAETTIGPMTPDTPRSYQVLSRRDEYAYSGPFVKFEQSWRIHVGPQHCVMLGLKCGSVTVTCDGVQYPDNPVHPTQEFPVPAPAPRVGPDIPPQDLPANARQMRFRGQTLVQFNSVSQFPVVSTPGFVPTSNYDTLTTVSPSTPHYYPQGLTSASVFATRGAFPTLQSPAYRPRTLLQQ